MSKVEKYLGLKESLDRFKNDLLDEKTRLLFSIAYKLGYDISLETRVNAINKERVEDLFTKRNHLKTKLICRFWKQLNTNY